ncbi:MAG TPA: hypothetical protein VGK73_06145 [Polyangiaceae bacterium]
MEKSLAGDRVPSWRNALLVSVLALGLLGACGDDGSGDTPAGAGKAGATAAGHGGTAAGRGGGRAGAGTAGSESSAGEGGRAGESGEGGAGMSGGDRGDAGSPEGGKADSGGTSGSGGRDGGAAGAGAGGSEDGMLGVKGGTVSDAAGDITLEIPAGALLGETEFSFAALASLASLPVGYVPLAGTAHEVTWSGAGFAANASILVRIRSPEALGLERFVAAPDVSFALAQPQPPVSGVSVCEGSSSAYNVVPTADSYEGQVIPSCSGNSGSGGSSAGGGSTVQVGLARPEASRFPAITSQPADVSVAAGADVSFSATGTGQAPLAYRWYRNGIEIPNQTGSSYRLGPASVFENGATFTVSVSNSFGSVTSRAALLHVSPPTAPEWNGQRAVLRDFGTGIGSPEVGYLVFANGFAVWNDGGVIEAEGANYGPVDGLSVPARSSPQVVTISGSGGYVVYLDNDANSTCSGATGNRLMAIGISTHQNQIPVPNSAPFLLFESQGDCIDAFTAGLADPNPALLPAPPNHNPDILVLPVIFALTEVAGGQVRAGVGGAGVATCGFCSDTTWEYATSLELTLPAETACTGRARLGQDGVMGRLQAHFDPRSQAQTTAVLAWVANDNLCAATLDAGLWSEGRVVFDNVIGDVKPVVALDRVGNALVVASRADDPEALYPIYGMTSGYRPLGGTTWEIRTLDLANGHGPVSTAFTPAGDALVAWINVVDSPLVVVARRDVVDGWDDFNEAISSWDAVGVGTGRPRLCVDGAGAVLALFEQTKNEDVPLQIWGKQWFDGFWSEASLAQDNGNVGSDANCQRHFRYSFVRDDPFGFSPGFVVWREADPADPSETRLVAHGASL